MERLQPLAPGHGAGEMPCCTALPDVAVCAARDDKLANAIGQLFLQPATNLQLASALMHCLPDLPCSSLQAPEFVKGCSLHQEWHSRSPASIQLWTLHSKLCGAAQLCMHAALRACCPCPGSLLPQRPHISGGTDAGRLSTACRERQACAPRVPAPVHCHQHMDHSTEHGAGPAGYPAPRGTSPQVR